jgi:hypothetical protein
MHRPPLQAYPVAQSVLVAQVDLHVVPPHVYGSHFEVEAAAHAPRPSQYEGAV